MIFTARQLEDLQKRGNSRDQIVLPYGARLSPLAADWARSKQIKIGYGPADMAKAEHPAEKPVAAPASAPLGSKTILWWCDGPCGAAKAALAAQARESNMAEIQVPNETASLTAAIKQLASRVKSGHACCGVLLVKAGAEAIVYANRCPSLRAIVGTCLESVEQGIASVGANVLIIEYPYKSLPQVRNLLSRFARGTRNLSEQTERRLREMTTCV